MSWWAILLLALTTLAIVVAVAALALRGLDDGFDGPFDYEEERNDRNDC